MKVKGKNLLILRNDVEKIVEVEFHVRSKINSCDLFESYSLII